MQVKFVGYNFWGNKIYETKDKFPIVKLEEGFYTLSNYLDIDSDPEHKLKDELIEIVKNFN